MPLKDRVAYRVKDEKINQLISQISSNYASGTSENLLRDMLTTIAKIGEEKFNIGDMKLINTTIKELRHAFEVFSVYHDRRKVTIFGSARTKPSAKEYKMAEEFAREIAQKKFLVITGSGPGIMEAGNKGAGIANSFGVNIRLPFEQEPNRYILGDSKLVNFKYFFTRKLMFIKESDATVLFPGGFGTMDEGFEVMTLFQTGKCRPRPIIMLEPKGGTYWKKWLTFIKDGMLKMDYISKQDLNIFKILYSAKEAISEIGLFYKNYHSIRYVNDVTVMRLNNGIPNNKIDLIKNKFSDILISGPEKTKPMEWEVHNNEHLDLPRIKMRFNRHDFGRLKELIDYINLAY